MLELQKLLRSKHNAFDILTSKYGIKTNRHSLYNNLVLFKYSQIDSPMESKLVQECRGIILDEDNNWNVVSFGYKKFFNYKESHADKINWNTARVYEKLDGSLITLYYYNEKWHIASSGVPDASGKVMGSDITFSDLFWKVWNRLGYSLKNADPNCCYMFELMTPYNRIVVMHKKSKIVLHGVRRLTDLLELDPIVVANENNWSCAKIFQLQSLSDIEEVIKTINPMDAEGYVVCDACHNRIKIKSPQYCTIAHIKSGFSIRCMLEIVRTNEGQEFLSYYPEYIKLYDNINTKYQKLSKTIEEFYNTVKHITDRKQFALAVKNYKFSGILFGLKSNKIASVNEALSNMNIKHLEIWLDLKSIEL